MFYILLSEDSDINTKWPFECYKGGEVLSIVKVIFPKVLILHVRTLFVFWGKIAKRSPPFVAVEQI